LSQSRSNDAQQSACLARNDVAPRTFGIEENQMTKTTTALTDPNFKDKRIRKKEARLIHALLAARKSDVLRAYENENVPDGQWPARAAPAGLLALARLQVYAESDAARPRLIPDKP
jgi:hypothetical protein